MSLTFDSPFLAGSLGPSAEPVPDGDRHRVDGIFDAAAAAELGDLLTHADPPAELHLDFSRASRVEDRGLAALAGALTSARIDGHVFFHGLSRHQIRLLAYFGVDANRDGPALLQ